MCGAGLNMEQHSVGFHHFGRGLLASIDMVVAPAGRPTVRVCGPGGYHLTNLLLHAANTVLLFVLFRRMTGATWRSAFVAALFALHPLHVEPVAWVAAGRTF